MPTIDTALTRLLNIQHPILLAPMYGTSGGTLAAAVSQAGGFGMYGAGMQPQQDIPRWQAETGNARVGIGFIQWRLDLEPEQLDVALAAGPVAIMLSFGNPAAHAQRIRSAGRLLICQVQSVQSAVAAAEAGADVIVAQGRDAGGHSEARRGTMGLVPAVVDAVSPIPVVAAGGIGDGRGLAAALSVGAAGVSMGTRFCATRESLYPDVMKRALVAAGGDETAQTRVFDIVREAGWPERYPGRVLRNEFFERWHGREAELAADPKPVRTAQLATAEDDLSQRVVWAGESVDTIHDIPSARDMVERIVAEAVAALRGAEATIRG